MIDRRDSASRIEGLWESFMAYCKEEGIPLHLETIVCPSCNGEGAYVNPDIDRNGITQSDEIWHDEEFWEGYASGTYDVQCGQCRGRNVIRIPAPTSQAAKEWDEWLTSMYEDIAIMEAERRIGA